MNHLAMPDHHEASTNHCGKPVTVKNTASKVVRTENVGECDRGEAAINAGVSYWAHTLNMRNGGGGGGC